MDATVTTVMDPDIAKDTVFLVTRRELAVLAVALAVVVSTLLIFIVTSGQIASALFGSS